MKLRLLFFLQILTLNLTLAQLPNSNEVTITISSGSTTNINNLANYTELRAFVGDENLIVVSDFISTLNGLTLETLGGVFVRSGVGSEDGGITIVADNGVVWKRLVEGAIRPEYFEQGGYTPEVIISNIITNERDRLQAASMVASNRSVPLGEGGVIELWPDKLYEGINRRIRVNKDQEWIGNNATLKLGDSFSTTILNNYVANTLTFDVADPAGLRVGSQIIFSNGNAWNQGSGETQSVITGISGNTITIDVGPSDNYSAGSSVTTVSDILQHVSFTDVGNAKIRGINFDGNRNNNLVNHEWTINRMIVVTSLSQGFIISKCNFYNTPSENIIMGVGLVDDCTGLNLGGSFVHRSSGSLLKNESTKVINCYIDGVCIMTHAITNHSEASVVISNFSDGIEIINCSMFNGAEGIVGNFDNDDNHFLIDGGVYEDFNMICNFTATSSSGRMNLKISGAEFTDCGDMAFQGTNLLTSGRTGIERIRIEGNDFINSRLSLENVVGVVVHNNLFKTDVNTANWGGDWGGPLNGSTANNAMIYISSWDDVYVTNNRIFGRYNTPDTDVDFAIYFNAGSQPLNPLDSDWHYGGFAKVSGNTVSNFRYSISFSNSRTRQWVASFPMNIEVSDNKIHMLTTTSIGRSWGIYAGPGMDVFDNDVVNNKVDVNVWPIFLAGVHDNGTGNINRLVGANAYNNRVKGTNWQAIVVTTDITNVSSYNCSVVNNYCEGTANTGVIADNTGAVGRAFIDGNTIFNTTSLPNLTSREAPVYITPIQ